MSVKELLTEGRWIDAAILLVLTKRLLTPITKMDAYKLGIVDKKGKKKRDPETPKEKDAYSMLNRLIIKIKSLLGTIGVAALGAFLVFLKEETEDDIRGKDKEALMEEIKREESLEKFDFKLDLLFKEHGINKEEYYLWKLREEQKKHLEDEGHGL
jgi:hypothetical protein